MAEAQNTISELIQNQDLTERQKKEIEKQKDIIKALNNSIDSLKLLANKLKQGFDSKSKEAKDQELMKQQYRKEYYEKLLIEAETNFQRLRSNYDTYKKDLKSKGDSLSPDKMTPVFYQYRYHD